MKKLLIEIETPNNRLDMELLEADHLQYDQWIIIPNGLTVMIHRELKKISSPNLLNLIIDHLDEVATGVLSAWLYDKLKKEKNTKLRINRIEVEIHEGQITKVISEQFEKELS